VICDDSPLQPNLPSAGDAMTIRVGRKGQVGKACLQTGASDQDRIGLAVTISATYVGFSAMKPHGTCLAPLPDRPAQPRRHRRGRPMDSTRTVAIAPDSRIAGLRGLSSGERLLGLYEHGVVGCTQRNPEQVIAALEELISLLDFDYGDIAEGFYRLYAFCLREIRDGRFDQPAWILRDLRETWSRTLDEVTASAAASTVDQTPRSAEPVRDSPRIRVAAVPAAFSCPIRTRS